MIEEPSKPIHLTKPSPEASPKRPTPIEAQKENAEVEDEFEVRRRLFFGIVVLRSMESGSP